MKILRNPEFKRLWLYLLPVSAAIIALGFAIDRRLGLFAAVACAAAAICLSLLTARWLTEMAKLTAYVSSALTGEAKLELAENREGELSILRSEIYKLAAALRQQLDGEKEVRARLADSLANVSHQLKTPLTTLTILSELLVRPGVDEAERLRQARELRGCVRRMDALTQALLKLAKLDAGTIVYRPETRTADALIDEALKPMEIPLELRNIRCTRSGDPENAVYADPFWTVEALGNLLKNAMEHTPEGGEIRITHAETPLFSRIAIENDGSGIDAEDLPRIFERFYKGKNAAPDSVGIGLSLARQLCAGQNGSVTAKNVPGGCRFMIEFRKRVL